jgi:hypothetical protein
LGNTASGSQDLFHNAVKAALTKDGWQITDDPLVLKVGGVDLVNYPMLIAKQ